MSPCFFWSTCQSMDLLMEGNCTAREGMSSCVAASSWDKGQGGVECGSVKDTTRLEGECMKWPGGKSDAEARGAEVRPRMIVDPEGGLEVSRPWGSAEAEAGLGGVSKEARAALRDSWLDGASTSILSSRLAAGEGGRGGRVGEERAAMM
jgi:hypothetical protein